ncbi:MAG: signal recognition particle-docking protein FtsY [Methylococcaceae bacterium]|nr:signal recognition particle-docking protein FtsY [Methylococcaceae bacterium]
MVVLRSLAWVGVVLALCSMLSAVGLYDASFQKAIHIGSIKDFFDSANLELLIHHVSLVASASLVLIFNLAAISVRINRLAVTLISVLLLLLLLIDVVLEVECTFCTWGMEMSVSVQPAPHFMLNALVLWIWFWLSLRMQASIVKITPKLWQRFFAIGGMLGLLALCIQPNVLSTLYALNYTWSLLGTGLAALLMLPLLAISFYARYTVLESEQKLPRSAPSALEQKTKVVIPKALAVPDVEQYVEPEPASLLLRLKSQLKHTRSGLGGVLASLHIGQRKIDADLLEEIESSLIMADIGMEATTGIIRRLTEKTERQQLGNAEALTTALKQELLEMLEPCSRPLVIPKQDTPYVILVVGINGAGKTTTIGKIAKRLQAQGHSVMLAAGDTFRAAAVEQLQVWGERNNIHVVAQHTGADSASVIYDGVQSAQAKGVDVLIADTAGRLHTKSNLMEELKKVKRIMGKLDDTAPHEVLLVLDAGTGQNALSQTKQFNETVALTGLVLTKLDGTAKGGIIFALAKQFGLPIRYIGIGEKIDDLQDFDAAAFVDALFVKDE